MSLTTVPSASRLGLAFGIALAIGAAATMDAGQSPAGAPARAALYTDAQATAGEALYRQSCSGCHGATLIGGTAPPLAGPAFETSWSDPRVTLADAFFIARTTMPPRASNTLTAQDHAAVFAYILKMNGFPAGATLLTATSEPLESAHVAIASPAARSAAPEFIPGSAAAAPASSGPDQATLTGASQSTDWLVHTHDYGGTRFSPLQEVNATTAPRLAPTCLFQVGDRDNFQTGPIVYNGTMYITTTASTIALDAATCRVKWRHAWQTRETVAFQRNRGVAIKDGRVFRGTPDGYLLALNSETGAQLWARRIGKPADGELFVMAPVLFEDLVLIGPALSERNVQGWVGAFRAADGTPVWRFNTVPKPGEPGFDTWKNPKGIPMGGGAVWTSFSLDTETGDLHVAVTNPAPDLPVHLRQGANLYTNSIIVLDARTGKLRWYLQLVPNDSHDWDLTHATPMFNVVVNGATRRLVVTTGKDGVLRALDRDTHRVVYRDGGDNAGERRHAGDHDADAGVPWRPRRHRVERSGVQPWHEHALCACRRLVRDVYRLRAGAVHSRQGLHGRPHRTGSAGQSTRLADRDRRDKRRRDMEVPLATPDGRGGDDHGRQRRDDRRTDRRFHDLRREGRSTVLYRFNTGGPIGGGIVTYAVGGKQYIAVAAGSPSNFWVDRNPGAPTIIVFALPESPAR